MAGGPRRSLACCMLIKAKMVEIGDLEDGDLELPEEEDDEEGHIRYYFFRGCFCLRTMVSK